MARILVVDDEEPIRILYEAQLTKDGHHVTGAASGKEALAALEKDKFDLITLDIRMPEMDGMELLDKIRARDLKVPIIMVTAYSVYKEDVSVWASDEYVVKSADLTELKEKIRYILGEKGE